jgi:hypothetical protein|nr:MAG TPA: hypothetical protein [Caudoviricetes sp.]
MIKDALQYVIELSQKRVENIDGKYFYFQDGVPYLVNKCHKCETLQLSTLTSLIEYIKQGLDKNSFKSDRMVIHVVSETEVRLITELNDDMGRYAVVSVKARLPKIVLNDFMNQENFIIQTQSMFVDNEDKQIVLKVAGNVEDKTVAQYGDDGVTQKATIKSGLANVEDVIVPNPVVLMPYRTFFEIGQLSVPFIFRMRNGSNGVNCALFEADGGMWKGTAVHEIAEYLKNELADESIVILS